MNAPVAPAPSGSGETLGVDAARRHARRRVLFFARLSFVLVGTMPWWLPLLHAAIAGTVLAPMGALLELPFMLVCHRLPARTIVLLGEAMPLCSRCAGIFSGLALGAILLWPRLTVPQARLALLGGGLLMLADVVTQDAGLHPVWHATRLATGTILGWIASGTLMTAIRGESQAAPR